MHVFIIYNSIYCIYILILLYDNMFYLYTLQSIMLYHVALFYSTLLYYIRMILLFYIIYLTLLVYIKLFNTTYFHIVAFHNIQ